MKFFLDNLLLILIIITGVYFYFKHSSESESSDSKSSDSKPTKNKTLSDMDREIEIREYYTDNLCSKRCKLQDQVDELKTKQDYVRLKSTYPKYLAAVTECDNYVAQHPSIFKYENGLRSFGALEIYLYYADVLMALGEHEAAVEWVHKIRNVGPDKRTKPISPIGSDDWLWLQCSTHMKLQKIYADCNRVESAILHGLINVATSQARSQPYEWSNIRLSNAVFAVGAKYLEVLKLDKKQIKAQRAQLVQWLAGLNVESYHKAVQAAQEYHEQIIKRS